jgi:ubiquinone/menaquinone biosynthesis C-methylase UbiE
MGFSSGLAWRLERAFYRTQHVSLFIKSVLFERTARRIVGVDMAMPPRPIRKQIQARFQALLDRDLANVERGHYPRELLFQMPLAEYARTLPALLMDARRTVKRMRSGNYNDLPADIDMARYPAYYRRNFHWQTDGYLSEHSAALYDLGVEILFRGTADIMRRQIIPPISEFLRDQSPGSVRLLDIACGTGRTLKQLAVAHPQVRYHGVDLSPFYIQAARRLLADVREVSLLCENAESLPYVDHHFDVITSVHLFHELPRNARRRVLDEAYRVLRPGGLLVIEDSIQPSDSPELITVLGGFAKNFHEPFFDSYLKDDLAELARERGFEVTSQETHLVAKIVMARKPAH